ncbi:type-F conjugative transfer system pilin assembly thiol-disulfide isomerase TrbB [Legionella sp.]|uniref:type-F conjugative transfer system pilin assembly thiol-disulfide isomerase TrbB n=1 Tax=Legionella sp. TaxID=459 RepID=UPI00322082EF
MKIQALFLSILLMLTGSNPLFSAHWLNDMINRKEKMIHANIVWSVQSSNAFFAAHDLVFFYASTCPYCHQVAPVLKRWAKRRHAAVIPLSFDNRPLAEFPYFTPATKDWVNVTFAGRPIYYPALFVVNRTAHRLYPIAIGSLTEDELDERMQVLIPKIKAYEKENER